ncbi:SDR family NAD(P)-dependent oxidoreductase [Mycetocola saprophilus]|uniref:SDR family NAD(P)-dependent oxidoreductase n=1 Tax=Mycetocola saprophilus TaxID=76636 RepID=UPI0004C0063C|nr:SDR family oxidoreductase [Mycetocola saprophilus]
MSAAENYAPVTLITGGTRGIGAATARRLAAAGHTLVLGYRGNIAAAQALTSELAEAGTEVLVVGADLSTDAGIDTLFTAALERFGHLDNVVNNAGATLHIGPLAETPSDIVREVININLTSAVLVARRAVREFLAAETPGVLVNVSSTAARNGSPNTYVHYAAAKAGVDALTQGLAAEVASHGIRVVGVAPGTTMTDIHADAGEADRPKKAAARIPLGRAAEPDEIAAAIAWLVSPDASYTAGTTIRLSGGA